MDFGGIRHSWRRMCRLQAQPAHAHGHMDMQVHACTPAHMQACMCTCTCTRPCASTGMRVLAPCMQRHACTKHVQEHAQNYSQAYGYLDVHAEARCAHRSPLFTQKHAACRSRRGTLLACAWR
eukprot:359740-Chlamydomonas_euryale.AAC.3